MSVTAFRAPPPAEATSARHPTRALGRWRLAQVAIVLAVVSMPLLRPAGPGNTGVVDLALLGAMLACALWASSGSHRLRFPYALPVVFSVFAGALAVVAAMVAGHSTGSAGRGIIVLAQDIFVFSWAAVIATIGRDRELLDTFCQAWAYSAAGWAAVLIAADLAGLNWLSGITAGNGIRASLTLGDPNLAADYFVCGLFVIRATRRPRAALWRRIACAVTIIATVLTLSNGGLLALVVATGIGALFGLSRRRGVLGAAVVGVAVAISAGLALATFDVHGVVTKAEQASPLVRDSLGRESESTGSRTTLATEGVALWLHGHTVLGVGPGSTEQALRAGQAPYVKEAHDDYLAALVERGVLGIAALILLLASVAVRSRRIAVAGGVTPDYLGVVPRPELLSAAVIAVGISATFYEVLHFRHVWALLGLVAALDLSRRQP